MDEGIRCGAAAQLWQELVHEAGIRTRAPLDETRESYLVFVLLRHQHDGALLGRTQALEWLAAQACSGTQRADAMRDVGDRCLLIAGLYPRLAERRHVDVDYFIELGRGAYHEVAGYTRNAYAELFEQLARSYRELVRTLRALGTSQARLLPAPGGLLFNGVDASRGRLTTLQ